MTDHYHIEPNDELVQIGDRLMRDVEVLISDEEFERIRTGYMCLKCFQRFETAWPKVCTMPVCLYPVAEQQSMDLARLYTGRLEQVQESKEDRDERGREHYRKQGIWIPESATVG